MSTRTPTSAVSPLVIQVDAVGIHLGGAPRLSPVLLGYAVTELGAVVREGEDTLLVSIVARLGQAFGWKNTISKVCTPS